MRFDYFDDPTGWGSRVCKEAERRGHKRSESEPQIVFIRLLTFAPYKFMALDMFRQYNQAGVRTLPGRQDCLLYDDKIGQHKKLHKFMPDSRHITDKKEAKKAATSGELGWPVISKSTCGAQSRNVRIHYDKKTLTAEIDEIFSETGLPIEKADPQRGYVFLQRFVPGNDGDLRVIKIGGYWMLLERKNRPDVPFASGSGENEPVHTLTDRHVRAIRLARQVVDTLDDSGMCAMDFVFDDKGLPLLLEVSCSWVDGAYDRCTLFVEADDGRILPETKRTGADWVSILVDEMEYLCQ